MHPLQEFYSTIPGVSRGRNLERFAWRLRLGLACYWVITARPSRWTLPSVHITLRQRRKRAYSKWHLTVDEAQLPRAGIE